MYYTALHSNSHTTQYPPLQHVHSVVAHLRKAAEGAWRLLAKPLQQQVGHEQQLGALAPAAGQGMEGAGKGG